MSFQDSAVIFFIALLLFGPKKLPELARQLGKLMGEFRRASNDFRMQMEDELRIHEQAERQKQIAAIEAAAPPTAADLPAATTPVSPPEPLDPHPHAALSSAVAPLLTPDPAGLPSFPEDPLPQPAIAEHSIAPPSEPPPPDRSRDAAASAHLPIATSGGLTMMPPATGLPVGRSSATVADAFASVPSAPAASSEPAPNSPDRETAAHG